MIRQRTKRQGGFYDNSISPGAKMICLCMFTMNQFYDNSISPGAKIYRVHN